VIATIILAVAATGFSSSTGRQRNGNLQIAQLTSVVITGADIRNLPAGENRIVRKGKGPRPTGTVTFFIDGANSSAELVKTGAGTLILPNANADGFGVTKLGPGTLRNTPADGSMVKELTGTLILAQGDSDVVYEFRDLGLSEANAVFFRAAGRLLGIKSVVVQNRQQEAMKGWPFERLLIGPAKGIAQVEGWKASSKPPVNKYVCSGGSCACSGASDCLNLSSSCTSDMNCDGAGAGIKCYCKAK
jgi:hypothetical protein